MKLDKITARKLHRTGLTLALPPWTLSSQPMEDRFSRWACAMCSTVFTPCCRFRVDCVTRPCVEFSYVDPAEGGRQLQLRSCMDFGLPYAKTKDSDDLTQLATERGGTGRTQGQRKAWFLVRPWRPHLHPSAPANCKACPRCAAGSTMGALHGGGHHQRPTTKKKICFPKNHSE